MVTNRQMRTKKIALEISPTQLQMRATTFSRTLYLISLIRERFTILKTQL
jgi:hypothetical protein